MSAPTQTEANDLLLTLPQAARRLSISRRTLERLIAGGQFPHPVKINRSSRVLPSDLKGYLDNLEKQRQRV